MKEEQKEIFFHVGTGKTGTTYLQYRVFPKFKGIFYIQRTRYRRSKEIINKTHHKKYLLSREFDQQLEQEIKWFSSDFPDTTPIIVFRRHDSYIASQYRRFVKNGFRGEFKAFFDLENDEGYFKKKDLDYFSQIKLLEHYFTQKPIVLFYEDMRENPEAFIDSLANCLQITYNPDSINLGRKHTSYSEKQLKYMMQAGKYINLSKHRMFKNPVLHFLGKLPREGLRYSILYAARYLPEPKATKGIPLIPKEELDKVKKYYTEDWKKCHEYAQKRLTE